MRGKAVVIFAVLFAFVCWNAQLASAQESAPSSKTNSSAAAKPKPESAPGGAYRLDFSVNELEDLKKVNTLMEEIRGPAGRTMWDKLGNVNEAVLANYLKNEYPQTVAVVLSKIKAEHASRVLASLPEDFALECV